MRIRGRVDFVHTLILNRVLISKLILYKYLKGGSNLCGETKTKQKE
jgi:hypothetical protein